MLAPLLPVQTILFQVLFLLIAIALEAFILHRKLNLSRQTSIEYAISINLLYTILGWLIFFFVQPLLPYSIRFQLISYIFFNRFHNNQLASLNAVILMAGIISFFTAYIIKINAFYLLELLVQVTHKNAQSKPTRPLNLRRNRRQDLKQVTSSYDASKATVILLANALSHSVMLGLLLLRSLYLNYKL